MAWKEHPCQTDGMLLDQQAFVSSGVSHQLRQWSSREHPEVGWSKLSWDSYLRQLSHWRGVMGNQVESRFQPRSLRQARALSMFCGVTARSRSFDWRSPTSPYSSEERIGPFRIMTEIPARLKPFSTSAS